jgi:hypothetical protein
MYFILKQLYTDYTASIYPISHEDYSLSMGKKMANDFPVPLRYEIDIEAFGPDEEDVEPDEDDTAITSPVMPTTFLPEPLFRIDFVEALRAAGVSNMDTYPAVITNPETGEENNDYCGVNIIGLVACADLSLSKCDDLADSHVFHHLVIDSTSARGADFFRLAECSQEILISDRIVQGLLPERFPDVSFSLVEDTGAG